GRAGADDRVDLVDEDDDLPGRVLDLAQQPADALLELAAVLGPGDQAAEVDLVDALRAQPLGHVAAHDPPGQALDDRGLADARLADQDRVVLGPPREDLHDPADFVVAPDDRVELALLGMPGQVAAELVAVL